MTAEVAVMNRQAIALAADSAVTVRTSHGTMKSWPSVTKIFALPEPHSVAMMIYGSTALHRVPWETIIQNFARSLPNTQYARLPDYETAFLRYVRNHRSLYPAEEQHLYVYAKLVLEYVDLRRNIEDLVRDVLSQTPNSEATAQQQREAINTVLEGWQQTLRARRRLRRLPRNFRSRFAAEYRREMREAKRRIFQDLPLTAAQSRRLTTIAHLMFEREWPMEGYSGLVVAGYGADDLFPSLHHSQIEGFALNYLVLIRDDEPWAIDRDNSASVRAFAQGQDVFAFMEGVQQLYQRQVEGIYHNRIVEVPQEILGNLKVSAARRRKLSADLSNLTHSLYESALAELRSFRQLAFSQPVIDVVSALPMEDLAVMAETLVNLTSFRQKVSMSVETVGGPVDVAVISKADGFIWIKRKSYYDLNQNPRVLAQ